MNERLLDPEHLEYLRGRARGLLDKGRDTIHMLTHDPTYEDGERAVIERYLKYLQDQPCTNDGGCMVFSNVNRMCLRCRLVWFMNAESRDQHTPVK